MPPGSGEVLHNQTKEYRMKHTPISNQLLTRKEEVMKRTKEYAIIIVAAIAVFVVFVSPAIEHYITRR